MTTVRLTGTGILPDGQRLFGPLDLSLEPNGWTCLLGPSGCGKSTVLRVLAGLDTGVAFNGTTEGGGLSQVAFMAQSDLLLPWLDVAGNIGLGARLRGQTPDAARIKDLVARLGLTAAADRRPASLSGGQRQRVALARTLMEDRPVVLLDEPFSALDARTRADMQDLAAEVLHGRTVLIVTHDPAEAARMGHKIILMIDGTMHEIDAPAAHPVRAVDDPDVVALQTELLARLRAAA